jgi:hypothetical protein
MNFRKKNYDFRLFFAISIVVSTLTLFINKDLGINLLTEIASVALTVFVINKIIERRERQKRISIDQRILRDIQAILASYFSIWKHLVWQYAPEEKIESENDLLRIYPELVRKSLVNERFKFVSLHHPESWELFFNNRSIKECFQNYHTTLINQIQSFIEDFKIYIEPELLDILLNILDDQYFKDVFAMNQEEAERLVIEYDQDPNKLESYIQPDNTNHLHLFIKLTAYGNELKTLINKFIDVNVELYKIKKYFLHPLAQFPL